MARSIDWGAVELAYRAGIRSLKDIGKEFGVSDAGILKRAKKEDWTRDLSAKIRAKAEAKVSAAAVSKEVSALTKLAEKEVVEANAQMQADVILAHRKDIRRSRELVMSLLAELEHQTEHRDLYEKLGELMLSPDDNGRDKMYEAYQKAMSLGGRTSTMKALAESLKSLVGIEREAFGVKDEPDVSGKRFTLTIQSDDASVL